MTSRSRCAKQVVAEKPFCRLLHFARDLCAPRNDPHVLVVAPMSGHHATLLRGTVETLLPAHEVYITDWTDARLVPLSAGGFDLADYIDYHHRLPARAGSRDARDRGVPAIAPGARRDRADGRATAMPRRRRA